MPTLQPSVQDLFTYGSLMCEDIMAAVVGTPLVCTPALLPGFRRFLVKNEQYPGVVADDTGKVPGIVYHSISPEGWSRLDSFEGEVYDRNLVTVCYAHNTVSQVYCYVFRPEFHYLLTEVEWDYASFMENGKQIFQSRYCGFKTLD
jgi:gamma-glutamylcyclotransferase (GGCT)/AIG2-like uncharacterized protein YtfP